MVRGVDGNPAYNGKRKRLTKRRGVTTQMRTARAILVSGIAFIAVAFLLPVQHTDSQSKSNLEQLQDYAEGSSGTIELSGSVVDQNGDPLDDVGVEVAEVSPKDMFGTLRNRKVLRVDSQFRIKRAGVQTIDCGFFKDGFYDERRSYSVPEGMQDSGDSSFSKKDELIVLFRIPDPAPLNKFEGSLRSSALGPHSVLNIRILDLRGVSLTTVQIEEKAGLGLPLHHIFLDPEIDDDGRLSRVPFDLKNIGGMQTVLRSGRIVMSQPELGDGLVAADVLERSPLPNRKFRMMTEAPLVGYKPFLNISIDSGEEELFFYCRLAGKYGKGLVTNLVPISEKGGGEENAYARIVIFLNPTGSRDVSYVHF